MTETKSLVLEQLHALLKGQDDVRADLQEIRMPLRALDRRLVSALVTNEGEIERITDRLDPSEAQR